MHDTSRPDMRAGPPDLPIILINSTSRRGSRQELQPDYAEIDPNRFVVYYY